MIGKCQWCNEVGILNIHHISYQPEKTVLICKKCHFYYHIHTKPFSKRTRKLYQSLHEIGEDPKMEGYNTKRYVHPWCSLECSITTEFWEIEANPNMACIEYCSSDPNNCEIAQKNWNIKYEEREVIGKK